MRKILSDTGQFQHGCKTAFISEDAKEKSGKVSTLSFFPVIGQVKKIMGSDSILFWSA